MARMTTPAEDTLTALIHLLDREGYDAVTADQLARQAGMSRASFFRHLGGKEEVVFADHAALLARLDDFLRGTSLGVREALEEAVLQVFRHHTADPDRARARSRLLRGSQALRTRELLTSHRYTELFSGWLATSLPARISATAGPPARPITTIRPTAAPSARSPSSPSRPRPRPTSSRRSPAARRAGCPSTPSWP